MSLLRELAKCGKCVSRPLNPTDFAASEGDLFSLGGEDVFDSCVAESSGSVKRARFTLDVWEELVGFVVKADAIVIVVFGGEACRILDSNSYSIAGFILVSAKA